MVGFREINLPRILVFYILNSATALDAADSEASGVGKAADDAGLPLEGALEGLVELERVLQVDDVDITIRSADN